MIGSSGVRFSQMTVPGIGGYFEVEKVLSKVIKQSHVSSQVEWSIVIQGPSEAVKYLLFTGNKNLRNFLHVARSCAEILCFNGHSYEFFFVIGKEV